MLKKHEQKSALQRQSVNEVDPIFELLSIHKPTEIDNLCAQVPRPPNSLPPMGLPIWEVVPLYWKLPIMPKVPKETTILYREKIGNKLFKSFTIAEYFLGDPHCYDVDYPYESMHDPHLTHYYKKKLPLEHMAKNGFLTSKGDVLCTLPEYNKYRRYLYRLQLFHIHNEITWNDILEREKFELRKFNEYLQRDIERDERKEFFWEVTSKLRNARLEKEAAHADRLFRERAALLQRISQAERRRMATKLLLTQRRVLRHRRAFDVMQDNCCMKRATALRAMRRMRDEDVELAARQRLRSLDKEEKRVEAEWERYKNKVEAQLLRFAREQQLLAWDAEEMEEMVTRRNARVRRELRRMEDLLEVIHAKQAREIAQRKRAKKKEEYIHAITKAWGRPAGKSPWLIEQAVITGLAAGQDAGGHNVLVALQEAKDKLDRVSQLPEEVTLAMDSLLENVIKEFTRSHVAQIIDTAESTILARLQEMASSRRRRTSGMSDRRRSSVVSGGRASYGGGRSSVSSRRRSSQGKVLEGLFEPMASSGSAEPPPPAEGPDGSSTGPPRGSPSRSSKVGSRRGSFEERRRSQPGRSLSQGSLSRGISFGTIETIGKFVTDKEMLPTKERPPTPVPSLENLATAIMEEPIGLMMTHDRISEDEKKRLQVLLDKLNDSLVNDVVKHFERKRTSIKLSPGLTTSAIRKADVIRRLTDQIVAAQQDVLNECDEFHLAQEYLIQELQGKVPSLRDISKDSVSNSQPGSRRSSTVQRSARKLSSLLRS